MERAVLQRATEMKSEPSPEARAPPSRRLPKPWNRVADSGAGRSHAAASGADRDAGAEPRRPSAAPSEAQGVAGLLRRARRGFGAASGPIEINPTRARSRSRG